jgi:hypothetical protein
MTNLFVVGCFFLCSRDQGCRSTFRLYNSRAEELLKEWFLFLEQFFWLGAGISAVEARFGYIAVERGQ